MTTSRFDDSAALENVIAAITAILPPQFSQDIKNNLIASVRTTLENMDIVTRSEIEVQEAMLQRASEKIAQLEARIEQLESTND